MKKTQTIGYLIDFINSGSNDEELFKKACQSHNDLKIYLCLEPKELSRYISKIKKNITPKELFDTLAKKQPSINISVEVYDRVVEMVRNDMEQYFKYNGFRMANAFGTQEDWISHFYVKYYYFANFYRMRWFFPEQLTKATKVKKTYKKYSDFLHLAQKSITEERRVQARKAAENPEASLNKSSMDAPVYQNNTRVTLSDIVRADDEFNAEHEARVFKRRILQQSENFEGGKHTQKIKEMLETGEYKGKKSELVLLRIFAYKAGMVTPKSVKFINSLSKNYKDKFGISMALLNEQMKKFK